MKLSQKEEIYLIGIADAFSEHKSKYINSFLDGNTTRQVADKHKVSYGSASGRKVELLRYGLLYNRLIRKHTEMSMNGINALLRMHIILPCQEKRNFDEQRDFPKIQKEEMARLRERMKKPYIQDAIKIVKKFLKLKVITIKFLTR